jgi:hypothetical protein
VRIGRLVRSEAERRGLRLDLERFVAIGVNRDHDGQSKSNPTVEKHWITVMKNFFEILRKWG